MGITWVGDVQAADKLAKTTGTIIVPEAKIQLHFRYGDYKMKRLN